MTRLFMTERTLPDMTPERLLAVHSSLAEASRRLGLAGEPIRLLRSSYVLSQKRLISLFAAANKELVHKAVELAQLPLPEVEEILELDGTDHGAAAAARSTRARGGQPV
jgi:hypothetical protein